MHLVSPIYCFLHLLHWIIYVRYPFQAEPPHIGHYGDYLPLRSNKCRLALPAGLPSGLFVLLGLCFIHDMWWLYHRAQRSYFWPSILQLILLIAQIAFVYQALELKITPTCDHNTKLVKYYPMLQKTAEINDCGRITGTFSVSSLWLFVPVVPLLSPCSERFAFQMCCPSGEVHFCRALENILPDF